MKHPIWAVVPYKGKVNPKQRLAEQLTPSERADLVHAMLNDVLTTLVASAVFDDILLVSRASDAETIADEYGISFYKDRSTNLPDALIDSSNWLANVHKVRTVFIIPADVPLITVEDLKQAVDQHVEVTVIPDQHQIGTNGLICTPPNAFKYVFDGKSYRPHLRAARAIGLITSELSLSSFSLDIDTYKDVFEILNSTQSTLTKSFLQKITSIRKHA